MKEGQMQGSTTSHSLNYGAEERRRQVALFHSTLRACWKKPCSSFPTSRIGQDQSFDVGALIKAFSTMFNPQLVLG